MLWTIDPASSTGLADQIAGNIRRAIGDGALTAGERLPPAGDLARSLMVNANTVLSAYRTLRDEDVLEFRRGRGVSVRSGVEQHSAVRDAAVSFVELGRTHGYSPVELAQLIQKLS